MESGALSAAPPMECGAPSAPKPPLPSIPRGVPALEDAQRDDLSASTVPASVAQPSQATATWGKNLRPRTNS